MDAKRKAIVCDMDKPDEKELWEWLQTLPHGVFSEETKQFWKIRMREAKRDEHELKIRKLIEVGNKYLNKVDNETPTGMAATVKLMEAGALNPINPMKESEEK